MFAMFIIVDSALVVMMVYSVDGTGRDPDVGGDDGIVLVEIVTLGVMMV